MYPGDARAKWPPTLLTDQRVAHYWDERRALGTAYLSNLPAMLDRRAEGTLQPTADAMWDAFFLYRAGDRWRDPLPLPIRWGYPIMPTSEQLAQELDALKGTPAS
jgi:hypothetical protein